MKFENRVSEYACPSGRGRPPSLSTLFAVCRSVSLWLNQDPRHIAVIHCLDGKAVSATVLAAFLTYARVVENPDQAFRLGSIHLHLIYVARGLLLRRVINFASLSLPYSLTISRLYNCAECSAIGVVRR